MTKRAVSAVQSARDILLLVGSTNAVREERIVVIGRDQVSAVGRVVDTVKLFQKAGDKVLHVIWQVAFLYVMSESEIIMKLLIQ